MLLFALKELPLAEYLNVGGVELAYRRTGDEGPPLLMIHGNSCDSAFFEPQLRSLADSHRLVAVDLRGHGQSAKPRQDYTFAGFADDCAAVCDSLGLQDVLVVGHSMGGAVAMELADRHPGLARAVVALDSTLFIHRKQLEPLLDPLIRQMDGPKYLAAFRGFFESLFTPEANPDFKAEIWQRMARTPRYVMESLLEEMLAWTGESTRKLKLPLLYVAGSRWRTDHDELAASCPQTRFERLEKCGHFMTLEEPQRINSLVRSFSDDTLNISAVQSTP